MPLNEQGFNAGLTWAAMLQGNKCRSQKSSFSHQDCELHQGCLWLLHFRKRAPGLGNHCHSRTLTRWLHLLKKIAVRRTLRIKAEGKGESNRKTEIDSKSCQSYDGSSFIYKSPNQYTFRRRYLDIGKRPHAPPTRKPLHLQMEGLQTVQPQSREARPQEKELHDRLVWSPGQVHYQQRLKRRKSHEGVREAESRL